MTPSQEILTSIETRLEQLSDEIAKLHTARAALERRASTSSRRTKVTAADLAALLEASDGLSSAMLADRSGADQQQVLAALREMERTGAARRTGARRTTRWHAVTDEDRIRARAAELAAQSRQAA